MKPILFLLLGLAALASGSRAAALDEFGPRPTWNAPRVAEVRAKVLDWMERKASESRAGAISALWPQGEGEVDSAALLDRVAESIALADPAARELTELCSGPRTEPVLPDFPWLMEKATPKFVRHNLRLYYGRWLVQESLYDEADAVLAGLEPEDVVDPAALLFYQTLVHQRLLNAEQSQQTALRLLEREEELPDRYQYLARLVRDDMQALKEDSLDHISRRMEDIRRRLDLGRAGKKVREVEDGVIASLDKLIKQLEEQQQQQQMASSSGGSPSGKPAEESRIMTQKGPGKVDKKEIGDTAGWGDLPPKEREAALQQIGQEFPSHYRDAIDQYFRKIASEEEPPAE